MLPASYWQSAGKGIFDCNRGTGATEDGEDGGKEGIAGGDEGQKGGENQKRVFSGALGFAQDRRMSLMCGNPRTFLQRLKPGLFQGVYGTTEVMPS
jgi:hypothetical protein